MVLRTLLSTFIAAVANRIDATAFNPTFPAVFPRFVQHAIWRYCAQTSFDVCNGNRVDDRKPCENVYCQIHRTELLFIINRLSGNKIDFQPYVV
jgi:hypothetical protein